MALSLLVTLNIKCFVKPLIGLILASIMFFYVELDHHAEALISDKNYQYVQTLTTVIGALFLIHGFTSVAPLTIPTSAEVPSSLADASKAPQNKAQMNESQKSRKSVTGERSKESLREEVSEKKPKSQKEEPV